MNTAFQEQKVDAAGTVFARHSAVAGLWVADDEKRMAFLPAYFTDRFMRFENAVFQVGQRTLPDGSPAYWEFALSDNGVPFLYPKYGVDDTGQIELIRVTNVDGDHEDSLHPILAGLHTCRIASVIMMERADKYRLSDDDERLFYDRYFDYRNLALDLADQLGPGQKQAFIRLID